LRVLWIGGGTSAGKTSIARQLAGRYGLTTYHVDEHEREHADRLDPQRHPAMAAWNERTLDETWVDLPVDDLVEATLAYSRERIELIAEDLERLTARERVVAEGFQLTPELVEPLLDDRRQAVWLLPTDDFRRELVLTRPHAWTTPSGTSHPDRAQAHRIERDGLIVARLRKQAAARGLRVIEVDARTSLERIQANVEEHFEPFLR
jgi:adenylate kinase family enzyme